ncbi:MAG TPA: SPASM domain-containing protein [Deltaproteobacteria bacterium]|nr:SPASM domain-containing protein [Deltaproteobacteria bacterium]
MLFHTGKKIPKNTVSEHPTQLYIELSTFCNLACRTCVRGSVLDFQAAHLSVHLLERLLDSIAMIPTLERIVLLGYGEALCNPRILDILVRLGQTGIPLCLVTNGQLITADIADLLVNIPVQEVFLSWDDYEGSESIRIGSDTNKIRAVIEELRRRRKGRFPVIGLEIVALKSNRHVLHKIVAASAAAGGEKVIVTNVFPYGEAMRDEILFAYKKRPEFDIKKQMDGPIRSVDISVAHQVIGDARACPFMEKGTLFVTARGDIAPCLELAHAHRAWYFNSERTHFHYSIGNIARTTLLTAWQSEKFAAFREGFVYYDFPDCLQCRDSQMCLHRSNKDGDCFRNGTPCGECLWARGVIRCP